MRASLAELANSVIYPSTLKYVELNGVKKSRGSSVGIVTRLRAGQHELRIPAGASDLSLFCDVQGVKLTTPLHTAPRFRMGGV